MNGFSSFEKAENEQKVVPLKVNPRLLMTSSIGLKPKKS
jgi:hypothetical protein